MTTLTVKNVPDHVHKKLRLRASASRRSLNSELLHIIESTLEADQDPAAEAAGILRKARELRSRFSGELTSAEVDAAIDEGRP